MVERKTTVEQGMRGRRIKALAQAVVAFAIIIGAFALEWNIGGLKEADRSEAVKAANSTAEKTAEVAVKQSKKNVAAVKKQIMGGCRNAQDFVNVNILMHSVQDFENFGEILNGLRFVNGEVQYPEVAMNGALLKEFQTFFDKVDVFSEDELRNCVAVLQRAKQYNIARLSLNNVIIAKNTKEKG